MTTPVLSPFDNEISWLYKWAQYWRYPSKLLLAHRRPDLTVIYEPLIQPLDAALRQNQSLDEIYARFSEQIPSLTPTDLSMLYVARSITQGQPLEAMLEPLNSFQRTEP